MANIKTYQQFGDTLINMNNVKYVESRRSDTNPYAPITYTNIFYFVDGSTVDIETPDNWVKTAGEE